MNARQHAEPRPSAEPGADPLPRIGRPAWPVLLATTAALALCCLPLLFAPQLPLVDLPAHLARLHIIDDLLKNGPLANFYAFELGLVPNLLFDAVGWLLLQVVPVEPAGAIYLALALAAQLFGTVLLHRALHGGYRLWPLSSAFLLANLYFFYGYLGYLAGVGLALLSLALWIALRDRSGLLRLVLGSIAALLLFLSHIVPLIVYGAAIAGYELQQAADLRRRPKAALDRLSIGAAQFVLPAILFLDKTPTAGLAHEAAAYRLDIKIGSLLATATGGAAWIDVLCLPALGIIALLLPLACRVRFAGHFVAAFACILLAFALMPWSLGPVVNLDVRMPLAIMLIAIAATDVSVRRPRLCRVLACVLGALLLARTFSAAAEAARFSDSLAAYRNAFRELPSGSVLFTGVNDRCPQPPPLSGTCHETGSSPPSSLARATRWLLYPEIYRSRLEIPRHIAAVASIDRDVFVPQIFATRGVQAITVRPPLLGLKTLQRDDPITIRTDEQMQAATAQMLETVAAALPGRPVFLLQQRIEGAADLAPEAAEVVARGPRFTLYQTGISSSPDARIYANSGG